jgi:hypothetical protein
MKKNLAGILILLCAGLGQSAMAGGGTTLPKPPPTCRSGIDGNRDCVGDQSTPARSPERVTIPKTFRCPASFEFSVETAATEVKAAGKAVSAVYPGFGPSVCLYSITEFETSAGEAKVLRAVVEATPGHTWVDFTANRQNYRILVYKSSYEPNDPNPRPIGTVGRLNFLNSFETPNEIEKVEWIKREKSTSNISTEFVEVPNSGK